MHPFSSSLPIHLLSRTSRSFSRSAAPLRSTHTHTHTHTAHTHTHSLPLSLQHALAESVERERERLKQRVKAPFGKRSLGQCTVHGLIEGGRGIPALYAQFESDEISRRIQAELASHTHSDTHTQSDQHLYERVLWFLLSKRSGSEAEVSLFAEHLRTRRAHFLAERGGRERLAHVRDTLLSVFSHTDMSLSVRSLLSLVVMHLQPESAFFAHRRETKKPQLFSLVAEDVLDIIALLPDLLALSVSLSRSLSFPGNTCSSGDRHSSSLSLAEGESFRERLRSLREIINGTSTGTDESGGESERRLVEELLRSFAAENVLVHVPRLVSCTLSDPFLATAATLCAFPAGAKQHSESEWTSALSSTQAQTHTQTPTETESALALIARVHAGLLEVFWDRALLFPLENPKSLDLQSLLEITQQDTDKH